MMAFSDHDYIGYAAITNKKFWYDLPADTQRHHRSIKDATEYAFDIPKKENDVAIETIHKAGKMQIYALSA